MMPGELKTQVDKIWNAFWTGGIINPLTIIEQFTYLLFMRQLDESLQKSEGQFNSLLQRPFKGEVTRALEPA